jgi:ABC-2 type transport system ATP-binding protein
MRQRLGIATALLGDPELLVLDEPTNGLDPDGIRWLRQFIRRFGETGGTVLISSHLLAEVANTVDHVVIVDRGRHVVTAPIEELTRRDHAGVRVRTPMAPALLTALVHAGHDASLEGPDAVVVRDSTTEAIGRLIAASGIVVYELRALTSDLEEIFFNLTDPSPQEVMP